MSRWLTSAAALTALAVPATAQLTTKESYLVIRVKLSDGKPGTQGTGGGDGDGEGSTGSSAPTPGGGGGGGYGVGPMPGGGGGGGGYGTGPMPGGGGGGGGYGTGPMPGGGPGGGIGGGMRPGGGFGSGGGPLTPGGGPSIPGGGAGGGNPDGGTGSAAGLTERSVHVLIPYKKITEKRLYEGKAGGDDKNPRYPVLTHSIGQQQGQSVLYPNRVNIQIEFQQFPTEENRLNEAYVKWSGNAQRKPVELLALISDALKAELLPLAERFSDSLVTQYGGKDKDAPADVAAYVKGYTELKAKLAEQLPNNPAADIWKEKFGTDAAVYADSPHYSVIHFSGETFSGQTGAAVIQTAELLEKNLKSFYLWHLREGFPLRLPDRKLVVVVTKNGQQLGKLREGLDGLPVASDSFYSPVHNLTVISPERTDELGRTFNSVASTKLDGFDRHDLLKGVHPKRDNPEEVAIASTYALVRQAIEDEALRAAVSREGSRQLFVTLGIIPQHVRLPKWLDQGMGSLLHHPKGGGVVEVSKDTAGIVVGLLHGHGAANYDLLFHFQQFYPSKKDGKDNKTIDYGAVLTNVLTDRYFDAVASGIDPDRKLQVVGQPAKPTGPGNGGIVPPGGATPPPGGGKGGAAGEPEPEIQGPGRPGGLGGPLTPGGGPGGARPPGGPGGIGGGLDGAEGTGSVPGSGGITGIGGGGSGVLDPNAMNPQLTAAQIELKAKASAWALTYYLTKNGKMSKLHAFLGRLNDLPRDMRVDKNVSMKLFCETFGLLKPNSQEVDRAAFDAFAKDWITSVQQQQPTYKTIPLKNFAASAPATPTGPNRPGFPGGPGLPGGGGGGGGGGP